MRNHNIIPYTRDARELSKQLRLNMTATEKLFWFNVKSSKLGIVIRRQMPVLDYVVDFYVKEIGLAIEIDGDSHDNNVLEDARRQNRIEELGITFIRFTNRQINREMESSLLELKALILMMRE